MEPRPYDATVAPVGRANTETLPHTSTPYACATPALPLSPTEVDQNHGSCESQGCEMPPSFQSAVGPWFVARRRRRHLGQGSHAAAR